MRLVRAATALLAVVLLSGCIITSKQMLIADEGTVSPFPDSFALFTYGSENDEDTVLPPTGEDPVLFTRDGLVYNSDDGELTLRFAAIEGDDWLIAASGVDGNVYGVARCSDDVLELLMMLNQGPPDRVLEAAPAEVKADIVAGDGGIEVATRPALDYIIASIRGGSLSTSPLVAWIGPSLDATPPTSIDRTEAGLVAQFE